MAEKMNEDQQQQVVDAFAESVAMIAADDRGLPAFKAWVAGEAKLVLTRDKLTVEPAGDDTPPVPTGLYL